MNIQSQLKDTVNYCAINNYDGVLISLINSSECTCHLTDKIALELAIKNNSIEVVKILLAHGANASIDGSQLLCQSISDGKNEIAKLLIGYGADILADDNDPLRIACNTRNYSMIRFLIKKGANRKDTRLLDVARRLNDLRLFNILMDSNEAALKS